MRARLTSPAIVTALVLSFGGAVFGQVDDPDFANKVLRYGGPLIIRHPLVMADMKIDQDQAKAIDSHVRGAFNAYVQSGPTFGDIHFQRIRERLGTAPPVVPEPKHRNYAYGPLRDLLVDDLGYVLTDSQKARLGQLMLQSEGVTAFEYSQMYTDLGLSESQVRDINRLLKANEEFQLHLSEKSLDRNLEYYRARRDNDARTYDEVIKVLTRRQRKLWDERNGERLTSLFGKSPVWVLQDIRTAEEVARNPELRRVGPKR